MFETASEISGRNLYKSSQRGSITLFKKLACDLKKAILPLYLKKEVEGPSPSNSSALH